MLALAELATHQLDSRDIKHKAWKAYCNAVSVLLELAEAMCFYYFLLVYGQLNVLPTYPCCFCLFIVSFCQFMCQSRICSPITITKKYKHTDITSRSLLTACWSWTSQSTGHYTQMMSAQQRGEHLLILTDTNLAHNRPERTHNCLPLLMHAHVQVHSNNQ